MNEEDFRRIEGLFEKQTEQFQRYLGVTEENFQHRLDLVIENVQLLSEKVDRIETDVQKLDTKVENTRLELKGDVARLEAKLEDTKLELKDDIGKIAGDLTAHRADTEAHHGVYRVKE